MSVGDDIRGKHQACAIARWTDARRLQGDETVLRLRRPYFDLWSAQSLLPSGSRT